jgi:muramoyltetrapeptide carboxypeptidase LdcA involved in peptidoglycan recycling
MYSLGREESKKTVSTQTLDSLKTALTSSKQDLIYDKGLFPISKGAKAMENGSFSGKLRCWNLFTLAAALINDPGRITIARQIKDNILVLEQVAGGDHHNYDRMFLEALGFLKSIGCLPKAIMVGQNVLIDSPPFKSNIEKTHPAFAKTFNDRLAYHANSFNVPTFGGLQLGHEFSLNVPAGINNEATIAVKDRNISLTTKLVPELEKETWVDRVFRLAPRREKNLMSLALEMERRSNPAPIQSRL